MAQPILVLSDVTADYDQFVTQLENAVSLKATWIGNLTTQTSQTLIELMSSIGTFDQAKLLSIFENAYSETAESDDAIRSIAQMQGIRMSRKLPSGVEITLTDAISLEIPPLTQFLIAGSFYFSREQISLVANVPFIATVFQGKLKTITTVGLGTDNQTFVSFEDQFLVSDQDVRVRISGVTIPKSLGGLWNYAGLPAYSDLTTADGRLMVVFGSQQFGSIPTPNNIVEIVYPLTDGAASNNQNLVGKPVVVDGFSGIVGVVNSNPTGGGDDKSILAYKNLASGSFGTYLSAVTKSQYVSSVGIFPGIIDAVTQAQREINPYDLKLMNTIRVSGLTTSPWTQQQILDFINYMQTVTMYSPRFIWQDAIAIQRDIEMEVYCFNTAVLSEAEDQVTAAITALFAPRPGILLTNFYEYDLMNVGRAAGNGSISYIIVKNPTFPMIVTAPQSPIPHFELIPGGGNLGPLQYAYGISTVNNAGEEGPPANWVNPQVVSLTNSFGIKLTWQPVGDTAFYKIWGRAPGSLGLLITIPSTSPLEFIDNGSITPSGDPPNAFAEVPIRYNSIRTLKVTAFFAERQQRIDTVPTRSNLA